MFAANQGLNQVTQPSWSITPTEVLSFVSTWANTGVGNNVTQSTISMGQNSACTGTTAYRTAVAHPDGNLYGAPFNATGNIMVINTQTNTVSFPSFGVSGLSGSVTKYQAGCFAPTNGKIYYPPYSTNTVLIIDPATQTSQTQTWGLTFSGADQYWSATLGLDNKIYCTGATTGNILVIDPVANTASTTTLGNTWVNSAVGRLGAVRSAKNGKIYVAPYNAGTFYVIDTSGPSATGNTSQMGRGSNWPNNSFQGISQAGNGNLVGFSHNTGIGVVLINPTANTTNSIGTATYRTIGPALGSDGRVYSAPFNNTANWNVYNPVANTVTANTYGNATTGSWTMCVSSNDRIYALQDTTAANATIRVLQINGTGNLNPPLLNTVNSSPGFFSGP
jgi:hypothetical protein